jgi:hypothetical protein
MFPQFAKLGSGLMVLVEIVAAGKTLAAEKGTAS